MDLPYDGLIYGPVFGDGRGLRVKCRQCACRLPVTVKLPGWNLRCGAFATTPTPCYPMGRAVRGRAVMFVPPATHLHTPPPATAPPPTFWVLPTTGYPAHFSAHAYPPHCYTPPVHPAPLPHTPCPRRGRRRGPRATSSVYLLDAATEQTSTTSCNLFTRAAYLYAHGHCNTPYAAYYYHPYLLHYTYTYAVIFTHLLVLVGYSVDDSLCGADGLERRRRRIYSGRTHAAIPTRGVTFAVNVRLFG